jgi:molybdate transport system regulatory protein
VALGPGKADLLEAIHATGSIATAARQMRMSYMRAWTMIQVMNDSFREPLVRAERGGSARGGAVLTESGEAVLKLYRKIEGRSRAATAKEWLKLSKYLRKAL